MAHLDNLSAVLHGALDLRLQQTPIDEPLDDDVQVRIHSVGICGTDLHFFHEGRTGRFVLRDPIVIGHETSGVVTKVGKLVNHLKVGDRVAIEPNIVCRRCEYCKKGAYNLCQTIDFVQVTPYKGHLKRYTIMKGDLVFKIPDNISMDEAALVEPFAVAVQACKRGNVQAGQKVLISGSGPIGLLCMAAVKAYGADSVVQTDIVDWKLKVSTSMGSDHVINVKGMTPQQIADKVEQLLGGQPDVAFECTGQQESLQTAIYSTKPGGCVLVVGMGKSLSDIPIMEAVVKEIDIKGVFCYANCHPTAISILGSGRVNLKPMITHRYPLERVLAAFKLASSASGAVKIVINC